MKKIFLIVAILSSLVVKSQFNVISKYGLNAAGLNFALALFPEVTIDKDITISSDVTVHEWKSIRIINGAKITATDTLKINGRFIADPIQCFVAGAKVLFSQAGAPHETYTEWWGAKVMPNIRDTSVTASNIDNVPAFEAAIASIASEHYLNGFHTANTIRLLGIYGITRKIAIRERMVNMIGAHGYYGGTGFKFIGTLTGDSAQRFMLEYSGADLSRIENVCFKGKRTTDTTKRMRGAISFLTYPDETPQRKISLLNVSIGDAIGFWGDVSAGYEFKAGITVGDNDLAFNNDFFNIDNLTVANCFYAILNKNDQAMNWKINNFAVNFCETMIYMPKGGRFTGETWYPTTDVVGYMIMGGDDGSRTLSFNIKNWDIEHSKGKGLIWANGQVVATLTNGQVNNDAILNAGTDGFQIVGGNAMQYNPQLTFDNIRFLQEGRAYFDCSTNTNANSKGNIRFVNCVAPEGVEFKFNTGSKTRQIYYVNIDGRVVTENDDLIMNQRFALTNTNEHISGGFLLLSDVIADGALELPAKTIVQGNKSYGPVTESYNKTWWRASEAVNTLTYTDMLQPNTNYEGVTVVAEESGLLSSGAHYIKVGTVANPELFGRITGTSAGVKNTITATGGTVFAAATSLVLTAFDGSNNPVNMVTGKSISVTLSYKKYGMRTDQVSPDVWGFWDVWAEP